jgi:2-iminobutanoate/2-iminopropanoate deaminase
MNTLLKKGNYMPIEKFNPEGLHKPKDNLYAHIVRATGKVFYRIGGQVALDPNGKNIFVGDMAAQIRSCYEQVTLALESVGLTWKDVVHILTFTTNMQEYMKHELGIVKEFFGEDPPASTLVEVTQLVEPEWLVEVQADAIADK